MSTVHLRITPEGSRNADKCNRFGIFAFPTFDLRFRVKNGLQDVEDISLKVICDFTGDPST